MIAGRDGLEADLFQEKQGPARRRVLEWEMGVRHLGVHEVLGHDRLDGDRHHAKRHVPPHAVLGRVEDGPQVQEVLQHPEAMLDVLQAAVVAHHLGGRHLVFVV